jgi:hypothetical protein
VTRWVCGKKSHKMQPNPFFAKVKTLLKTWIKVAKISALLM